MSGIDGIGKRGNAGVPVGDAGEAGRAKPTGTERSNEGVATFREVAKASATTEVSQVGGPTGASALERLRAGQVDLNGYLDLKVDEATAALSGLPKAELDTIRHALRTQLATDPTLADLVTKATGAVPSTSEE